MLFVCCLILVLELGRSLYRKDTSIIDEGTFGVPLVAKESITFPTKRTWTFDDYMPLTPYQHQAPALRRIHVAFMEPLIMDDRFNSMYRLTQQTRLPRYHALVTSMVSEAKIQSILGSSSPTVTFESNAIPVPNASNAIERLLNSRRGSEVFVEGLRAPLSATGLGTWNLVRFTPNQAVFNVSTPDQVLFTWADTYTPDWRVTVDGEPAPLLVADVVRKAVVLSPGTHEVRFSYFPFWYVCSFWCRAGVLTLALATLLVGLTNKLTAVVGPANALRRRVSSRNLSRT